MIIMKPRLKQTELSLLGGAEVRLMPLLSMLTGRSAILPGAVLDPVLAIRQVVRLMPGIPITIDIVYGISESRQQSKAALEKIP
jgi:hypothetical protein